MPAALGRVEVRGSADVLTGYLPDPERDVRAPLAAAGYGLRPSWRSTRGSTGKRPAPTLVLPARMKMGRSDDGFWYTMTLGQDPPESRREIHGRAGRTASACRRSFRGRGELESLWDSIAAFLEEGNGFGED